MQGTTDGFALELMVGTGSISWARRYGGAGTLESLFSVTHSANGVMYAAGFQAGEGKGPVALFDFTSWPIFMDMGWLLRCCAGCSA